MGYLILEQNQVLCVCKEYFKKVLNTEREYDIYISYYRREQKVKVENWKGCRSG